MIYKYNIDNGSAFHRNKVKVYDKFKKVSHRLDNIPVGGPDYTQVSHSNSIYQISCHYRHPSIFLSSSSDDEIHLSDERVDNHSSVGVFHSCQWTQFNYIYIIYLGNYNTVDEWRDVKWKPNSDHSFACCDSKGGVL